jgi:hypothetical protein
LNVSDDCALLIPSVPTRLLYVDQRFVAKIRGVARNHCASLQRNVISASISHPRVAGILARMVWWEPNDGTFVLLRPSPATSRMRLRRFVPLHQQLK